MNVQKIDQIFRIFTTATLSCDPNIVVYACFCEKSDLDIGMELYVHVDMCLFLHKVNGRMKNVKER